MRFKKIRTFALATSLVLSFGMSASVPLLSAAASPTTGTTLQSDACKGLSQLGGSGAGCNQGNSNPVYGIIGDVVNILSYVVGIASIIMIIVAGLKYVTSGGDSNGVASAKNTLIYALVGLIIAAIAQFFVHYALSQAT